MLHWQEIDKMIEQRKYDCGVSLEHIKANSILGMKKCLGLITTYFLKKRDLTYADKLEVAWLQGEYIHHRDVAIKRGADVSRFPKRIRLTKTLTEKLKSVEENQNP